MSDGSGGAEVSRRDLVRRAAVAAGVTVWAAPAILGTAMAGAAAGSPLPAAPSSPTTNPPTTTSSTSSTSTSTTSTSGVPASVASGAPAPSGNGAPAPGGEQAGGSGVAGEVLNRQAAEASRRSGVAVTVDGRTAGRLPSTGGALDHTAVLGAVAAAGSAALMAWRRSIGMPGSPAGHGPWLVRAPGALWRRAGDDRVIVLAPEGPPIVLAGSGPLLWDLLDGPVEVTALAGAMAEAYGAAPDEVLRDIVPVLARLTAQGAVEDHASHPSAALSDGLGDPGAS